MTIFYNFNFDRLLFWAFYN